MRQRITRPWAGGLDCRAFQGLDPLLYRRVGDRGQALIGAGARARFTVNEGHDGPPTFTRLKAFLLREADWAFGHLAYDLKNEVEGLVSRHPERMGWPLAHWFIPRFVVKLTEGEAVLWVHEEDRKEGEEWLGRLTSSPGPFSQGEGGDGVFTHRTTKAHYLQQVRRIMGHLQRGDVYEVNYCTERTANLPGWDVYTAFQRMLDGSDAPHASFYCMEGRFALCASPERFLRFEGGKVTAQPMKGTRPRSADAGRDRELALELAADEKERGENIMALDVMRNDLSRTARSGTVRVEELCAVKSHTSVHQMVSTVGSVLAYGLHPVDAIAAAWPMASMTGAPKVSAMRLIDQVEDMRRGLFSGSLGFFGPDGTADLNVVIRTVQYDARSGEVSLCTGSAITATCDPEKEWEECELKARSVINALGDAG